MSLKVAVIGARGYVGQELLALLGKHDLVEIVAVGSRQYAGQPVSDNVEALADSSLVYVDINPEAVAGIRADVWFLALPNGVSRDYIAAIENKDLSSCVIDLSADHRFDPGWVYGLPEQNRVQLHGANRIANPGCYATGAQLALLPVLPFLVSQPVVFGVSGFSGAGTTPSPRNNPDRLKDNLMPYTLTGHIHQKEISHQLQTSVSFMPHVAPHFRGISLSISVQLEQPLTEQALNKLFCDHFADEPLIEVRADIPEIQEIAGNAGAIIGGFSVDPQKPCRAAWVCVLDNLLKGAASQAVQNMNLAYVINETTGINHD